MREMTALPIQYMGKLESLGIDTSCASMYYVDNTPEPRDAYGQPLSSSVTPAFTLSNILEYVKKNHKFKTLHRMYVEVEMYNLEDYEDEYTCVIEFIKNKNHVVKRFHNLSLIEAAYDMIVWCAENKYLKS